MGFDTPIAARLLKLRAVWLTARRAGLRRALYRIERRLRLGLVDPFLATHLYTLPRLADTDVQVVSERQREALLLLAGLRRESYLALNWERTGGTITLLNQSSYPFNPPVDWQAQPVPDPA